VHWVSEPTTSERLSRSSTIWRSKQLAGVERSHRSGASREHGLARCGGRTKCASWRKSRAVDQEISELIQSIQKEARKAVENMDRSTGIVNEGWIWVGTERALRKISNVVTEVYKFAQEIGAATNEQSHGFRRLHGLHAAE